MNGDTIWISQYKAVKPRKAYWCVSRSCIHGAIRILRITYDEGFVQILAKEDSLGLDYAVLDEIVNVFQRGVQG